ncbi:MAG: substrate-binding domain-containing protein, partial [Actinomycetales bacterium]
MINRFSRGRAFAAIAALGVASVTLAACSSSSTSTESSAAPAASEAAPAGGTVAVSLITKDSTNPFFVAMQEGAKEAAAAVGVDLTVGSGQQEGDDAGQIALIENAIAQGQAGILITPMSVNVNDAIKKARDAGLYVIAL